MNVVNLGLSSSYLFLKPGSNWGDKKFLEIDLSKLAFSERNHYELLRPWTILGGVSPKALIELQLSSIIYRRGLVNSYGD